MSLCFIEVATRVFHSEENEPVGGIFKKNPSLEKPEGVNFDQSPNNLKNVHYGEVAQGERTTPENLSRSAVYFENHVNSQARDLLVPSKNKPMYCIEFPAHVEREQARHGNTVPVITRRQTLRKSKSNGNKLQRALRGFNKEQEVSRQKRMILNYLSHTGTSGGSFVCQTLCCVILFFAIRETFFL